MMTLRRIEELLAECSEQLALARRRNLVLWAESFLKWFWSLEAFRKAAERREKSERTA